RGIGGWRAAHPPPRRRVAGVGVQHPPDAVRRGVGPIARPAPRSRQEPRVVSNALATMWFYITDSHADAERAMREGIVPTIHRPEDILRDRLPVGPGELFAEKLSDFARAGAQRVFIWPVADETRQLELF